MLSYFSRIQKEISLEGANISIHACLLKNKITIIKKNKRKFLIIKILILKQLLKILTNIY